MSSFQHGQFPDSKCCGRMIIPRGCQQIGVVLLLFILVEQKCVDSIIVQGPSDTTAMVNESTYFNCSTSIRPIDRHSIIWFHFPLDGGGQRNYVYDDGRIMTNYKNRFDIEINFSTGTFNLLALRLESRDAGRYECRDDVLAEIGASAELTVLESNLHCESDLTPVGVVAPTQCDRAPDEQLLSCSLSFNGKNAPRMTWRKFENPSTSTKADCVTTGDRVICNATLAANLQLTKTVFICELTTHRYNCSLEIKNTPYVFSGNTTVKRAIGEDIRCSANSSQPCSYKWKWFSGGDSLTVSTDQTLKPTRVGLHRCEATCPIGNTPCTVDVMFAEVYSTQSSEATTGQYLWLLLPLLIIITAIIVSLFLKFKRPRPYLRVNITEFMEWRGDILKGIDVLPLKDVTPGKIIVIGKHAGEVLTGINEEDVLIAAAEFGKGRIVTISHDRFAAHFMRPNQEENNAVAALHKNLKRWLTRDTFDTEKSIVDAEQDVSKETLMSSKIVLYSGRESKINADDLTEYVRNGGALLHCFTPWGWRQLNPGKTIFDAPYVPLVTEAGLYYTMGGISVPDGGFVVKRPCIVPPPPCNVNFDDWRRDILKDIGVLTKKDATPGKIKVIGRQAAAILTGGKEEDVLVAAAEFGGGRIVACAHDRFATNFLQPEQDINTGRRILHKNLKRWLTRDTFDSDKSVVDAGQGVSKERLMSAKIVLYHGTQGKINADDLTEYVRNGGALLHCITPWGWLQYNKGKTVFDAPYVPLVTEAGLLYTAERISAPVGGNWPCVVPPASSSSL